jgi:hypothetical protein
LSAPVATQTPVNAGAYFGLPNVTRPFEQRDNNDNLVTSLSNSISIDQQWSAPFKTTDIVEGWTVDFQIAQSSLSATGISKSPYFPYVYLGEVGLNLQNQFDSLRYHDGADALYYQMIRPRGRSQNVLYQNPESNGYSTQTNLMTATNYDNASANVYFTLDLPAGLWFDKFYLLNSDGSLMTDPDTKQLLNPVRTFVSYQFMSGNQRFIQPKIKYNPVFGVLDTSPFNGTSPTGSATATIRTRRRGYYQPQGQLDSPITFPWQYVREYKFVTLGAITERNLPISFSGQILSCGLKFWDPAGNSGKGAPIDVASVVTQCDFVSGSGLPVAEDTPRSNQKRLMDQSRVLLPQGMLAWDFAKWDMTGDISNQFAINGLNTSGVEARLKFNPALSTSAYVVIMVEGLKYLAMR